MILGENGEKMSKSRGNVINPDDIVRDFGADSLRLYEMFIGDFEKSAPWSQSSIRGCKRFLERVAALPDMIKGTDFSEKLESSLHKTIKKVTEDIDNMKFNTAIATIMSFINEVYDYGSITKDELVIFIKLLCPFAPHLCEEIGEGLGLKGLLSLSNWPAYDEAKTIDATAQIAVQINGKVRDIITLPLNCPKDESLAKAKNSEKIVSLLEGKTIVKEIVVPNKIINIVVR